MVTRGSARSHVRACSYGFSGAAVRRRLGGGLLLLVRPADRRRRDGAADEADQRDQREHVRQDRDERWRTRRRSSAGSCRAPARSRTAAPRRARRRGATCRRSSAARAMNPRPAVMFSLNRPSRPNDRYAPARPASTPRRDDREVAHAVDVDADGVGGARMLADRRAGAGPTACGREEPGQGHEDQHQPDHQVHVADDVARRTGCPRSAAGARSGCGRCRACPSVP